MQKFCAPHAFSSFVFGEERRVINLSQRTFSTGHVKIRISVFDSSHSHGVHSSFVGCSGNGDMEE